MSAVLGAWVSEWAFGAPGAPHSSRPVQHTEERLGSQSVAAQLTA